MQEQRAKDHDMKLIRLAEPYNMGELILLQSLLDASGIAYLIRHANISSLYPGLPGLTSHVLVEERDYPRAEAILQRLRVDVREVTSDTGG
jgi:putative signal transducing protein